MLLVAPGAAVRRHVPESRFLKGNRANALRELGGAFVAAGLDGIDALQPLQSRLPRKLACRVEIDGVRAAEAHPPVAPVDCVPEQPRAVDALAVLRGRDL